MDEVPSVMVLRWLMMLVPAVLTAQGQPIVTEDIPRFWEAYDALTTAEDHADSVACFQRLYLDRASEGLKRFVKVRKIRAEHFVELAGLKHFWTSIRPNTLRIRNKEAEINAVLERYEAELPGFKRPTVCFAIGNLSTGGTTRGGWVLVGAEIACADSSTAKHELSNWLQAAMRPADLVLPFVAHEAVHIRQRFGPRFVWSYFTTRLRTMSMMEGTADFITREVAGVGINEQLRSYGFAHESELWKAFQEEMGGLDISNWLYQGPASTDRPADLGYFLGERIASAYYARVNDKRRALKVLLRTGMAGTVVRCSGYDPSE